MAHAIKALVAETSTTTGAGGVLTLDAALVDTSGFTNRRFSAVCSVGDTTEVLIRHVSDGSWAHCHATYSAANQLTLTTTIESSTGSAITWAAGTKEVVLTPLATRLGGIPIGGTTGQWLQKASGTNFDDVWTNTVAADIIGGDFKLTRTMLQDFGYSYFDSTTTNALNYVNGSHQRWAPATGAQTLSITNWPPTGNLGELLIEGVNLGAATITWPTINWIKFDGTTTTAFSGNGVTLQASGTDWILLWTRNGGTTIYGKVVR